MVVPRQGRRERPYQLIRARLRTQTSGRAARPCGTDCVSSSSPKGVLLAAAGVAFAGGAWAALSPQDAGLSLLLVALALVAAGFAWLEAGPGSAKEVALVAVLGGVGAAGRVLFAAVPGVQPLTVVTVAAGAALGPRIGFAVGAVGALVSNFYLGQGIWTPWQMLAWGGCGVAGAFAARVIRRRWAFAALCFALGFAFSSAMDLWHWYSFWPHTWEALTVVYARGVWFSAAHAIGNVVFALAIGPELRRLLERYGRRLRVEIGWA
jgi:energy-coupling factor transport system substrate-specific component